MKMPVAASTTVKTPKMMFNVVSLSESVVEVAELGGVVEMKQPAVAATEAAVLVERANAERMPHAVEEASGISRSK